MPDGLTPIDETAPADSLRSTDQEAAQGVGSATSVAEAFYSNGTLSGSFAQVAAIQSQANYLQNSPEAAPFLNKSSVQGGNYAARNDDDDKDPALEAFRAGVEALEQRREQERQLWAQTSSTFGNVTMTGAEWGAFSKDLSSEGALREWLIEKLRKDGKTKDEAEKYADRLAEIARIQAIPESQRTEAERKVWEEAMRDKAARENLELANEHRNELAATKSVPAAAISKGDMALSVSSRADELTNFPNAPDLSGDYKTALAAQSPLDTPKTIPTSPAIEKAPPPALQANGFDA